MKVNTNHLLKQHSDSFFYFQNINSYNNRQWSILVGRKEHCVFKKSLWTLQCCTFSLPFLQRKREIKRINNWWWSHFSLFQEKQQEYIYHISSILHLYSERLAILHMPYSAQFYFPEAYPTWWITDVFFPTVLIIKCIKAYPKAVVQITRHLSVSKHQPEHHNPCLWEAVASAWVSKK